MDDVDKILTELISKRGYAGADDLTYYSRQDIPKNIYKSQDRLRASQFARLPEATAKIEKQLVKARIDELNKLEIKILNSPLQPSLPILRNCIKELESSDD